MSEPNPLSDRVARLTAMPGAATAAGVPPLVADAAPAPPRRRSGTAPFAGFEWALAARYLRPTRKEGIISIISILSLLGIMIGVAALIIVMSVMNGFRHDL